MSNFNVCGISLETKEYEVFIKLIRFGNLSDEELPFRSGMVSLIAKGLADRDVILLKADIKPNFLTQYGKYVAGRYLAD